MKFFYNYIFRLIFLCILLASSMIVPLYAFLPSSNDDTKVIILFIVVFIAAVEITLIVFLNNALVAKPVRSLIKASKKITKGEYVQIKTKFTDEIINELALSMNNTAYEFENLEQMRKSFVSNASHELRSPLTSMQGFLQAILDGTIGAEDTEKYLKIVLRETKRLSSLINSMLDLSRMESGKYPLNLSRFDINTVIKQIVERFEPNLIKKEVQLDVDFVRDATHVFADKDKIIQVLINLIDNAIKYSPAFSRILVTTHIHGKKIYVTVKDKGFGISKKDQMLIWDRFYMADKARTPTKSKGTGLGLSIVKKIIDDHKEVIWVESNKGAGATFIFTLSLFDPNKHKFDAGKLIQATDKDMAISSNYAKSKDITRTY